VLRLESPPPPQATYGGGGGSSRVGVRESGRTVAARTPPVWPFGGATQGGLCLFVEKRETSAQFFSPRRNVWYKSATDYGSDSQRRPCARPTSIFAARSGFWATLRVMHHCCRSRNLVSISNGMEREREREEDEHR
jgi:hypothetical protein